MRLIDKVVQARPVQYATDAVGRHHAMRGAGAFAGELRDCPVRYMLDRDASRQCAALFRTDECLPDPRDPLSRPPARDFWLEFYTDGAGPPPHCHGNGAKMGLLVRFDDDERSGTVACFREDPSDGSAEFLQCTIAFDFGGIGHAVSHPLNSFRIRQQDLPEVDRLLDRTTLTFTKEWFRWADASGAARQHRVDAVAGLAWCAVPMVTSFCALLNAEAVFRQTGSTLDRLNLARARRRQPALLDHVEVRLDLTAIRAGSSGGAAGHGTRQTPRLHLVRGHRMSRNGKTFWRSAHFRGDAHHPLVRNVSVTAGARR